MEPKWLELARAELCVTEVSGSGHNKRIVDYFADAGHPEVKNDETAWCAGFVGAMLKRAGMPNSGSLAARSYLKYGTPVDTPEPGDIVVFSRGNSTWEGHVGFYVGETDTAVKVLGGNQSNKVSIANYSKTRLLGYRRPIAPTAPALREAGSRDIQQSDSLLRLGALGALTAAGGGASGAGGGGGGGGPAAPVVSNPTVEGLQELGLMAQLWKAAMEGAYGLIGVFQKNIWVSGVLSGLIMVYVGWRIRQTRLERAKRGDPLSNQKG